MNSHLSFVRARTPLVPPVGARTHHGVGEFEGAHEAENDALRGKNTQTTRRPDFRQHQSIGQALTLLRSELDGILQMLSGRATAPIVDAALKVERSLYTLVARLAESLGESGPAIYPLELPPTTPCSPATRQRLNIQEHQRLGTALFRMRNQMQALSLIIANFCPKSSSLGRVVHKPERAIDGLRCKLDDLFCSQHREDFDTRVYYPGACAVGGGR